MRPTTPVTFPITLEHFELYGSPCCSEPERPILGPRTELEDKGICGYCRQPFAILTPPLRVSSDGQPVRPHPKVGKSEPMTARGYFDSSDSVYGLGTSTQIL